MTSPKILITDSISQSGVDELARDGALEGSKQTGLSESALVEIMPDFSAVVARSQTVNVLAVARARLCLLLEQAGTGEFFRVGCAKIVITHGALHEIVVHECAARVP